MIRKLFVFCMFFLVFSSASFCQTYYSRVSETLFMKIDITWNNGECTATRSIADANDTIISSNYDLTDDYVTSDTSQYTTESREGYFLIPFNPYYGEAITINGGFCATCFCEEASSNGKCKVAKSLGTTYCTPDPVCGGCCVMNVTDGDCESAGGNGVEYPTGGGIVVKGEGVNIVDE